MQILERYIRGQLARNYVIVNVLLLGLFGFIDLGEQLDDVGKGAYSTGDAILFTLYQLPRRLIDLTPFSALLAAVVTLGAMAANRELVIMRGAGISPPRIAASLLKTGVLLLAIIAALELYVAPALQQRAFQMRAAAVAGNAGSNASGFWARSGDGVVYIGALRQGRIPENIEIYRFGPNRGLRQTIFAHSADIVGRHNWRLHGVVRKNFGNGQEVSQNLSALTWSPALTAAQLRILDNPPENLSPPDLYRYTRYLQAQHQNSQAFRMALWQKLALPLTTIAMMLLAAPLAFANPRGRNLGLRIVAGAAIGLLVYSVTQAAANLGLVFNLNPALCSLAPGVIITAIAVFWLRRLT